MEETTWYFEDNKDKYSAYMLDQEIDESGTTLREWLEYGISSGYIDVDKDFSDLSTREISKLVDWINYLETK